MDNTQQHLERLYDWVKQLIDYQIQLHYTTDYSDDPAADRRLEWLAETRARTITDCGRLRDGQAPIHWIDD